VTMGSRPHGNTGAHYVMAREPAWWSEAVGARQHDGMGAYHAVTQEHLREADREGRPQAQSHTVLKPTSRGGRVVETVYRIFDLVFLVVLILVLSLMPRVPILASKFYLLLKRGTYIASKYR
jgi:hypothetical protein